MRRFAPLAALSVAALVVTSAAPARASGSDDAVVMLVALAVFDVVSLPADIVMAAKDEPLPRSYLTAEAVLGGLQAAAGGIGLTFCVEDKSCKGGAGLPVLAGFTAWTTAMLLHGSIALVTPKSSPKASPRAALAPVRSSFAVVPLVGDGRASPAGIGLVGRF